LVSWLFTALLNSYGHPLRRHTRICECALSDCFNVYNAAASGSDTSSNLCSFPIPAKIAASSVSVLR
jgi:hypothetical protein